MGSRLNQFELCLNYSNNPFYSIIPHEWTELLYPRFQINYGRVGGGVGNMYGFLERIIKSMNSPNNKILNAYLGPFFNCHLRGQSKFLRYKLGWRDCIFIPDDQKLILDDVFNKAMRIMNRFRVAMQKFRLKKREKGIGETMAGVPLSDLPESSIFVIEENVYCYRFYIPDLLQWINSCLSQSDLMIPTPRHPVNPLTNVMMSTITLTRLYLTCIALNRNIPHLFKLFYKSMFLMNHFKELASYEIHENALDVYTNDNYLDFISHTN